MSNRQPTWLTEPCPEWCAGHHQEDDLPGDRLHESQQILISAVTPRRAQEADGKTPPSQTEAAPCELYITRYQYIGDPKEWVYIGDGCNGIELSPESVERLRMGLDFT